MLTNREDALIWLGGLHPGATYIIGNAIARDMFEVADKPNNLYLVHAMGQTLAVGMGMAYAHPDKKFVVIDGDGSAIMGAAMWPLLPTASNLTYYVLRNGIYETTGGQSIIWPADEPEDLFTVDVKKGKINRPKKMEIRPIETDHGYLSPVRIKTRFLKWFWRT